MKERSALLEDIHRAKRDRILDLIRRATANGTHQEVAEALARDWTPLITINKLGQVVIMISDLSPSDVATSSTS